MRCQCGAEVEQGAQAKVISNAIEEGDTIIDLTAVGCSECSGIPAGEYIFNLEVE